MHGLPRGLVLGAIRAQAKNLVTRPCEGLTVVIEPARLDMHSGEISVNIV